VANDSSFLENIGNIFLIVPHQTRSCVRVGFGQAWFAIETKKLRITVLQKSNSDDEII
jgi:hypothetical protein